MSTKGATVVTLMDLAKKMDPDGKPAAVIELLSQTNEILDDMHWKEGNLPTGHLTTLRTGLPTVYWRMINQGVQSSKSHTAQVTVGCGMLEAWSEVDVKIAKMSGNVNQYRLDEAKAFIESMNQEFASTLIYGNAGTAPEEFNGFAVMYSDIGASSPENSQNIISGGGSGSDNTSIYLVVWGDNTVHGIYPKGSTAGLIHEDKGIVTVQNAGGVTGAKMDVYQDKFSWDCGVVVKDWRYLVRACNIDVSNLVAQSSNADLIVIMMKMIERIPNLNMGRPVFYMNRSVRQYLQIQRRVDVKAGGQLSYDVVDGKRQFTFQGIPIKLIDGILETESTVA